MNRLSRLMITGEVDVYTPVCVISEIADAHGIIYDKSILDRTEPRRKLVGEINERPVLRITFDSKIKTADLQFAARFVNSSHHNWKKTTLKPAFDFLISFCNS